jgi:prevent-host-death family protein
MHKVNLDEAKIQLFELIKEVIEGEEIVITKNNKPVVKLVSISHARPQPQFGSARGLINMADDFDEPLEDFQNYIQ